MSELHIRKMPQDFPGLEEEHAGADEQGGDHGRVRVGAQLAAGLAGVQDFHQPREVVAENLFRQVAALAFAVLEQLVQDQTRDFMRCSVLGCD